MKKILLATDNNRTYSDDLKSKGFDVVEFALPLTEENKMEINNSKVKCLAIIQILEDDLDNIINSLKIFNKKHIRRIIVVKSLNNSIRDLFIEQGIAEVFVSGEVNQIVSYIDQIAKQSNEKRGKFLILENNKSNINILENIICLFNYDPIFVETIDQLFENLEGNIIQFLFVNLGIDEFDVKEFLKRSYNSSIVKTAPIIPYKNMSEGLFIHEMISGLNRISKVILSLEELFTFLIKILFRKELYPQAKMFIDSVDYENVNQFVTEPLNKIYNILGVDIFSMKNITSIENINNIELITESVRMIISKLESVKWLIKKEKQEKTIGFHA